MKLTDKERAKRKRLAADYLAFRIEHKRPGTGDEVTAWIAERDAAAIPERKEVSPEMARALRLRALDLMAKLVCRDASGCTKNGACLYIDCQHNPHYLPPPGQVLLTHARIAKLYPDETRRANEGERFWRVEEMLAKLEGKSDAWAAAYLAFMVEDAPPIAREVVAAFVERIKTARALKPS